MKVSHIRRAALATGMSLALTLGTVSCSRDYTVAYVYATSAQNASVSAFQVDYQTGTLVQIAGSPFTAGIGRNPVAIVASPSGKNVYVISHDDSTVTEFAVGTDGKLYGQNTYNVIGSLPTSAAVDSTGAYLYVTSTFQTGFTPAGPGPGNITIFPINGDGSLNNSAKSSVNVGYAPVGIAVSNPTTVGAAGNVFVYVVDQESTTSSTGTVVATGVPSLLGFKQTTSSGALTYLSGSACTTTVCTGYRAGVLPSAVAIDPTTAHVYVTDKSTNQVLGYLISNSSTTPTLNGSLTALSSGPFTTGLYPVNVTIEPRGKYLYTVNYNGASVSSFSINADGSLGGSAGVTAQTGPGPTCITIEPALGIYAFTSNSIDGTVSALKLNANTGQLSGVPNSPFPASALPSCLTSVPNGPHSQSLTNP